MADFCAAGRGLDTLMLPALVPVPPGLCHVPPAEPEQMHHSDPVWVCGQLGVFHPGCVLPLEMVPHHWRGCTAPLS